MNKCIRFPNGQTYVVVKMLGNYCIKTVAEPMKAFPINSGDGTTHHPGREFNRVLMDYFTKTKNEKVLGYSLKDFPKIAPNVGHNNAVLDFLLEKQMCDVADIKRDGLCIYSAKAVEFLCKYYEIPNYLTAPYEMLEVGIEATLSLPRRGFVATTDSKPLFNIKKESHK